MPWTISLLKTADNATINEKPCNDPDLATEKTFQVQDFFMQARTYGIEKCKGIQNIYSIKYQITVCNNELTLE